MLGTAFVTSRTAVGMTRGTTIQEEATMHWWRMSFLRLLAIVSIVGGTLLIGGRFGSRTASAANISTDHVLVATLLGAAEVTSTGEPGQGDPDGFGTAIIDIEPQSRSVCFVLRVSGIAPATMAHIHVGAIDATGPIVIHLAAPNENGFSQGCTISSPDTISAILANPSNYYVNVHNGPHPGGALRGQLGHKLLMAELTGEAEVNSEGEPNQGDLDGSGMAAITVDTTTNQVCGVLRVADIEPATMAHIHVGRAGANGGVVVLLGTPNANGVAVGCEQGAIEVVDGLTRVPSNYYVNVHNEEFRAGALRGQLSSSAFTLRLSGADEVNAAGEPNQGDPDGTGTAAILLDAERGEICYSLRVADIAPATMAHIHVGPPGANGGVVVTLGTPSDESGIAAGCIAVAPATLAAILATPANYYVNVHNAPFQPGALRGQLAGTVFRIALSGAQEVNNDGVPNQGDPDGTGTAVITLDAEHGDVCFVLRVQNIEPATMAHIHVGPAGSNGGIVVTLGTPDANGLAVGCAEVPYATIAAILATPANYYVNVHNGPFPPGALRGQLAGTVFRIALSGAQEVNAAGEPNQGDPDGTGTAVITLDAEHDDVCFVLRVQNIEPATMAHIHVGPAGSNGGIVVTLGTPGENGVAVGCVAEEPDTIAAILATPANYYVNVHNQPHPGGALRGQLAGTVFRVALSGAQEVNMAGEPNQGDPDGSGTAVITLDAEHGDVCYVLRVQNIEPATMAHIHRGSKGTNGPIVVTLGTPGENGVAIGCVAAEQATIAAILMKPSNYYVNVHNTPYPPGALRGQLQFEIWLPLIIKS
jgi:hypothetical protein